MIIDEKSPLLVSTSTPVASNNCGPLIDNLEKKKLHAAIFLEKIIPMRLQEIAFLMM